MHVRCGCSPLGPCPIAERILRVSLPGADVRYRLRAHLLARTKLTRPEKMRVWNRAGYYRRLNRPVPPALVQEGRPRLT